MFMAGLGVGSWASGALIRKYGERLKGALRLYGLAGILIGVSALLVPMDAGLGPWCACAHGATGADFIRTYYTLLLADA